MSDKPMDKLSINIDKIIKTIKNEKNTNCSKSSKLIPKLYLLVRTITTKCSMEDLQEGVDFFKENLYNDTIAKPLNEKKKQFDDVYESLFYTMPDLIDKIKIHIKDPEFLKEFKPILEPFTENLAKYICDKYGPDKVEETLNKMFSGISSSLVKGVGDGIGAIPIVGNITNAVKGVAGAVGNGLRIVNDVAEITKDNNLKKTQKLVEKYDNKNKQNGGAKKKKFVKKCSNMILFILTQLFLNLKIKNKTKKKRKKNRGKKKNIKNKTKNKTKKRNKKRTKRNKKRTKRNKKRNKKRTKRNKKDK